MKACSAGVSNGLAREHVAQRVLEKEKSLIQTLNHVLGKMGYEFDAQSRFQAITSMEKGPWQTSLRTGGRSTSP